MREVLSKSKYLYKVYRLELVIE